VAGLIIVIEEILRGLGWVKLHFPKMLLPISTHLKSTGADLFYKVATADSLNRLVQIVADLLHQGWTPIGGIAFDGQVYIYRP
jgi:hypothetical protein